METEPRLSYVHLKVHTAHTPAAHSLARVCAGMCTSHTCLKAQVIPIPVSQACSSWDQDEEKEGSLEREPGGEPLG